MSGRGRAATGIAAAIDTWSRVVARDNTSASILRDTTVAVGLGITTSDTVIVARRFDKVDKVVISSTSGSLRGHNIILTTIVIGIKTGLGRVDLASDLNVVTGGDDVSRQNEA